jgi:hypothetical protein
MSELQEIRNVFRGLDTLYQTYPRKVDPAILHDLLMRELEKSERASTSIFETLWVQTEITIQNIR